MSRDIFQEIESARFTLSESNKQLTSAAGKATDAAGKAQTAADAAQGTLSRLDSAALAASDAKTEANTAYSNAVSNRGTANTAKTKLAALGFSAQEGSAGAALDGSQITISIPQAEDGAKGESGRNDHGGLHLTLEGTILAIEFEEEER